jgi:hypothetical protein
VPDGVGGDEQRDEHRQRWDEQVLPDGEIRQQCAPDWTPTLNAAKSVEAATGVKEMLTARQGQRLGDWLRDVETNGAPTVRSFATGLRSDLDAVTAGLTTD